MFLGRSSKDVYQRNFENAHSFLGRKRNLPKIFLRSFENVAPESGRIGTLRIRCTHNLGSLAWCLIWPRCFAVCVVRRAAGYPGYDWCHQPGRRHRWGYGSRGLSELPRLRRDVLCIHRDALCVPVPPVLGQHRPQRVCYRRRCDDRITTEYLQQPQGKW